MIRDRLKAAARKAALRAFKMERQAEDRAPREKVDPAAAIDFSKIPKLVDGDGDTPGPNHKTRIGRTWVAAQMASGVSPVLFDVRHPEEWLGGILPGAVLLPGEQLREQLSLLPDKALRVTVYDSDGGPLSDNLAEWLRSQGWGMARQLQGGWAEWLEQGEPTAELAVIDGAAVQIGSPAALKSGGQGVVQAITVSGSKRSYTLLQGDGTTVTCGEDALSE